MVSIKDQISKYPSLYNFIRSTVLKKRIKSGVLLDQNRQNEELEKANQVFLDKEVSNNVRVGLVKDSINVEGYEHPRAYYPKYERFLKNNTINYVYYDILRNDWIEKAKDLDAVIWHTDSDPSTQEIAFNKIYFLEKKMGVKCLPSVDEIWSYEDKVNMHYLYKHFNLPEIPTFVTHSREDAIAYINETQFPIISKLATGSASEGVYKLNTKKKALSYLNSAFSLLGKKTYFSYKAQKDYLLFQQFIPDASYDLRIVVIGDKLLGYYRLPQKGDFKASGSGIYEKKEIPVEALELAYSVKEKFGSVCLATDLLYSETEKKYYIIESSIFIGVDTCEQLVIDGIAGYYQRESENDYTFKKGKYWIQELALKEFFLNIVEA